MWIKRLLLSCVLAMTTLTALAFERPFPPGTKRGTMTPAAYPNIVINDKNRTLSPGARIWNQRNTIDMPASIRGEDMVVHYTENQAGQIDRVWILTAQEIARPAPKPIPVIKRNVESPSFDSNN
tara:strand:- start:175045 stop:175416 length:372 start_codon:yes stop_codon:yes gene_type:complete